MTNIKTTLMLVLFFSITTAYGQEYFVGDKIKSDKASTYLTTISIAPPFIEFKEKGFLMKVNRDEVFTTLKSIRATFDPIEDKDYIRRFDITINYLNSTNNLIFDKIWTSWLEEKELTWDEAEEKKMYYYITRNILRELICELIASGKFQLIENGSLQKQYFYKTIYSNYGGYGKGVLSKDHQLLWLCPPFAID